ncbi:unnamed protein product [Notodromas monacha]|uniref:Short coiled-coil protein n=1 Tax=Notodromas monacha TaxID=399045 RepID=A0A7R9GFQ2_9CRUS|nr:unnamed protein product [Notodromas monacha]CAG0921016.1 unnamed protein product [Notodromas monacha]
MEKSEIASALENGDIPLADEDVQVILSDDPSSCSIPPAASIQASVESITSLLNGLSGDFNSLDGDVTQDEQEEKARLISGVLELQNTLDDLSRRVDSVKEENLKLRSENQVLSQYIENLMDASSVFQTASPPVKKKVSGKTKK